MAARPAVPHQRYFGMSFADCSASATSYGQAVARARLEIRLFAGLLAPSLVGALPLTRPKAQAIVHLLAVRLPAAERQQAEEQQAAGADLIRREAEQRAQDECR